MAHQNGKGDKPRNISKQFFNNYDLINWSRKPLDIKADKQLISPVKTPSPTDTHPLTSVRT